jgi:uncharacterized protein (TIGR03382 family)
MGRRRLLDVLLWRRYAERARAGRRPRRDGRDRAARDHGRGLGDPHRDPLAPDTLYQAFSCSNGVCDRILTEFTTGTETDESAPPPPSRGQTEFHFSGGHGLYSCGRTRALELGFNHNGILVADVGDAQLDIETLSGSVTAATTDDRLFLGVGLCEDLWPGDEDAVLQARFGVFDVSGNFSGWTEPESLELPSRGCSTTSDESPAPWAYLLLLAWVRRRSAVATTSPCRTSRA